MRILVLACAIAGAPSVREPGHGPGALQECPAVDGHGFPPCSLVKRVSGCALTRLLGIFLHDEIAHMRAQLAELRALVQGAGAWIGERHLDDLADARRARRHDDNAVGQVNRLFDGVGDEHHRLVLGGQHLEQQVLHGRAGLGIQRTERLIHQQELRLDSVGARKRQALAHAARQHARPGVGETRQGPSAACSVRRSASRSARGRAVGAQVEAEGDVVLHRQPGKDAVVLEDDAAVRPRAADRLAIERDGCPPTAA